MYIFTMLSISNAFLFATAANQDIDTFAAFESCKGSYSCHLMPTLVWKPCSSHVIAHLISSHGWPWSDGLICLLHAILNGGTDGHNHVMTATHDALPLIEGSAIVLMRLHLIDLVDDALEPCPHALVAWLSQKTCNKMHEYAYVINCKICVYLSTYLPIYLSIHLSIYLTISLSLSIYLSTYLSIYLSIYPSS